MLCEDKSRVQPEGERLLLPYWEGLSNEKSWIPCLLQPSQLSSPIYNHSPSPAIEGLVCRLVLMACHSYRFQIEILC